MMTFTALGTRAMYLHFTLPDVTDGGAHCEQDQGLPGEPARTVLGQKAAGARIASIEWLRGARLARANGRKDEEESYRLAANSSSEIDTMRYLNCALNISLAASLGGMGSRVPS